jgi:predicted glycosyltransferase
VTSRSPDVPAGEGDAVNHAADPSHGNRRVLFYSHDGTGLGHLRITLGVASAYANLRPRDSILLLTGSLHTSAFALPANVDYVKLPAMPKRDLYASLPPTEGYTGSHNSTIRFRTALALATVKGFDPHLVVVDHAPAGLFQELMPALDWLRRDTANAALALLMRDVTFGPEQTRAIWTNEAVYPLLDEAYDRILIYGDRRVFDPITAYAMSERAAARTRFCGFLAPAAPRRSPAEFRRHLGVGELPLVTVSVGVSGPLLPEAEREEIAALAAGLPHVRILDFDADFSSAVRAADAVVSMGGYNSVAEAVYFGKRPVVVPRLPGAEEQILRAQGFARLGLATVVDPGTLSQAALWSAIDDALQRTKLDIPPLPFDGLNQIARELANL